MGEGIDEPDGVTGSWATPPGAVEQVTREDRADPLGLHETAELVRGAGTLVVRHWLPLLALAFGSLAANEVLAQLAVVAGRAGAVPGFLVLALVPLSGLVALVGMLLVMRSRQAARSDVWGVVAAVGSVLVPYLVVYQSRGSLRSDLLEYVNSGVWEDIATGATSQRLPQIGSWLVLGIVVAALLVRGLGNRLASRSRWADPDDPRRGVLRVVVGYAEGVWVTLGVWVIGGFTAALGVWWTTRTVAQHIFTWWESVRAHLPSVGALGDAITAILPVITDAVVTGLVVPLSMLTIAVIVYGLQVADTVTPDAVDRAADGQRDGGRGAGLRRRVGADVLRQAWGRLADPEGRFGALLGGAGLVVRSGFAPVLGYCVLFTLVAQVDIVLWWLARMVLGYQRELVWEAWYDPLNGIAQGLTLVLTAALTAVFADRLLMRFGAAGQLRTGRRPGQSMPSSMKAAGGKSVESTRTEAGTASSGISTSND